MERSNGYTGGGGRDRDMEVVGMAPVRRAVLEYDEDSGARVEIRAVRLL
jgi:hypothetical protein